MKSAKIPKQLAAYRLGLLSRTYSMWRELFEQWRDLNTLQGPLASMEQLRQSTVSLANEIPNNVYGEMRDLLEEKSKQWEMVEEKLASDETGTSREWPAEEIAKAARDQYPNLVTLADVAADALQHLQPWYQLGSDLGQAHAALFSSSVVPSPAQVIKAACYIPSNERRQILCLRYLTSTEAKSKKTLQQLLCAALKTKLDDPNKLLVALDAAIQRCLASFETQAAPASRKASSRAKTISARDSRLRIRWIREDRRLYVNDELECKVGPRATNLMLLLDAFQAQQWAVKIPDPFHARAEGEMREKSESMQTRPVLWRDPEKLNSACKKLARRTKSIEFHGDGEGNAEWKPRAGGRNRSPGKRK